MRFVSLAGVILLLTIASAALAQSNPFDGLNSRGRSYSDPALYAQHKAQWLARVEAMPENVDVLEGAADFFAILDRPLALELLERASALEPNNPKWVPIAFDAGDMRKASAYSARLLDESKNQRGGWNQLDAWRQDVEAGRIPNFGANLRY